MGDYSDGEDEMDNSTSMDSMIVLTLAHESTIYSNSFGSNDSGSVKGSRRTFRMVVRISQLSMYHYKLAPPHHDGERMGNCAL
jgi:hypothetical protein